MSRLHFVTVNYLSQLALYIVTVYFEPLTWSQHNLVFHLNEGRSLKCVKPV